MRHLGIILLIATALVVEMTGTAAAQLFGGGSTYHDRPPYNPYQYPDDEYHRERDYRHNYGARDNRCPRNYKLQDGICTPYSRDEAVPLN